MTEGEIAANVIAFASFVVASFSAWQSWKSAEFVQRKIGMVSDPEKMTEVLPVWYVERMAQDTWGFGLLLTSGDILAIERIDGLSDDHHWMEVTLLESGGPEEIDGRRVLYAGLKDRRHASVRVDQVQAAFELWTS